MALSKEVYQALEDIVGPEFVTEHIGVIDSYQIHWENPRYGAVILPKNTEEVQAVVKLCNKYNISFKASSTALAPPWTESLNPDGIRVDLTRMNKIIEINVESMYAVVEPYVICAQLQAEVMKRGLNINVMGGGVTSSAMPMLSHFGGGHTGETTSYRERNLLGIEWVTPEGEIVKFGSFGSVDEWFCGDGPGPSLRGIVMGAWAPMGGLGIFTKAAQKLYPWPGPNEFDIEGVSPHYIPKENPTNFYYGYFSFRNSENMCEAQRKMGESEIAYEIMGFNAAMLAANMATSNPEDIKIFEQFRNEVQGNGFQVILAGNSPPDLEYKKRVLYKIMEEQHGKSLKLLDDPKIGAGFIWRCIRICASLRECFRYRGGTRYHAGFLGGSKSYPKEVALMDEMAKIKSGLVREGLVRDDLGGYITWTVEWGHIGHGEMLMQWTELTPRSLKAIAKMRDKGLQVAIDTHYGIPSHVMGDGQHNLFGPLACNYHLWMRKVKKAFDPNDLSDSMLYVSGDGKSKVVQI